MDHARASFLPKRLEETLAPVYEASALLVTGHALRTHLVATRVLIDLILPFLHSGVS